jgi:hypothetical protein
MLKFSPARADSTHTDAGVVCSLRGGALPLTWQVGMPLKILCGATEAMLPFGVSRTQEQPCLMVNPAEGTAGASGLMAATVQPHKFPRPAVFLARQISGASRSFTALRPQAVQPARPSP